MNKAFFVEVPSEHIKNYKYLVRRLVTGEWRCECPAFVFSKEGTCKHIVKGIEAYNELVLKQNGIENKNVHH